MNMYSSHIYRKCNARLAAIQPNPAAVIACLSVLSIISPAVKRPRMFVCGPAGIQIRLFAANHLLTLCLECVLLR